MSWAERMARAAFRGVSFLTDDHESGGGRRLVVHEYPGAETWQVEDLGAKVGEYRINAYFIGRDYDLARDAFLAALAEPGAGWLRHPWLGKTLARARSWSVKESNEQGGYCAIGIEFVADGGEMALSGIDRFDAARAGARGLSDAAVADFSLEALSADSLAGVLSVVSAGLDGVRDMLSLVALPFVWADRMAGLLHGLQGDLFDLFQGGRYARSLRALTDILGSGADTHGYPDTARPRLVASLARQVASPNRLALSGVAAADGAARRNVAVEAALRQRLLAAAATETAITRYRAAADRDAALAACLSSLDALMPGLSDPVFQAAAESRRTLIEALASQDLAPTVTRRVVSYLPATVLAHRLAVEEPVFIARNRVRHPLFVRGVVRV
uniref:Mu-like prophage DNA circulation protein n=1 Tax=Candidatus Kentrum sp. LPFa TaxID=2126335 RepID=A0A450WM74_9GAMM|nr:MAG: Mu-like prophage DNA circulation protein [Candidatus Kentron sp. LPFa]